jgi:hypothetical protein
MRRVKICLKQMMNITSCRRVYYLVSVPMSILFKSLCVRRIFPINGTQVEVNEVINYAGD